MPIKLNGSTSGYSQLQAAAVASSNTLTLPAGSGSLVAQSTTTAPTNGQIPIGNGTDYTAATITAGSNITVTNASGSVTIAATVPSVNALQLAKAWVRWAGSTGTIASSYNVSSVTRSSTGQFVVNFTTALADANYVPIGMVNGGGASYGSYGVYVQQSAAPTTTTCSISTLSNTGVAVDNISNQLVVFGN